MRGKSIALLVLALGCGLIASIGITQVMANRKGEEEPSDMETVYVVKADVNLGDTLSEEDLKLEEWPVSQIPPGTLFTQDEIVGRRARIRIGEGTLILDSYLLKRGEAETTAASLIETGDRVITVKVGCETGGADMILPGDSVDVLAVMKLKSLETRETTTVTRTFLQNIKVFAVNDEYGLSADAEGKRKIVARTLSLIVDPQEAQLVATATAVGEIRVVMRSPDDEGEAPAKITSIGGLLGQEDKETAAEFLASTQDQQSSATSPPETGTPGTSPAGSALDRVGSFLDRFRQEGEGGEEPAESTAGAEEGGEEKPTIQGPRMRILHGSQVDVFTMNSDGPVGELRQRNRSEAADEPATDDHPEAENKETTGSDRAKESTEAETDTRIPTPSDS